MERPRYVERDNEIVYRPPYLQSDAFLCSWLVRGRRDKQQEVVDQALNAPSGGRPYRYRVLLPYVALVLAKMGRVTSLDPRDSQRGWVPEVDLCFWILTAAEKDGKLDHFAWYIPYIWVDSPYTLANGRESFGFPKSFAKTKMPESPSDDGPFFADALLLPTYTPETEVQYGRVFELTRAFHVDAAPEAIEGDHQASFAQVIKRIFDIAKDDVQAGEALVEQMLTQRIPVVYLKQYRDAVDGTAACYQGIIESDCTIRSFEGAGFLPLGWQLQLNSFASVDVPGKLGIAPQSDIPLAFWARMSFSCDLGKEVFRAP